MGEEERMGEKHVSYLVRQTGEYWLGVPHRDKACRGTDPQPALILKVIRSHLRKWGIQPVKFIHLGWMLH